MGSLILGILEYPTLVYGYQIAHSFIYPVGESYVEPISVLPNNNGYKITQNYLNTSGHLGVDLGNGLSGGIIRATANGKVTHKQESISKTGFGYMVRIEHLLSSGELVYSQYGHMLEGSILVQEGEDVVLGQPIGKVGNTGRSTGSHLHFEIKIHNQNGTGYEPATSRSGYYDPLAFVREHITPSPNHIPDLSLVRGDGQIYLFKNGQRYSIQNLEYLQNLTQVYPLLGKDFSYSSNELSIVPLSAEIIDDGLIVKSPDLPGIYLVQNDRRRVFSEQGYLQRGYKFDADPDSPTYILLPRDVVNNIPLEDNPIFQDTKDIGLQLIFKNDGVKTSSFVVGETKESAIIVRGDGYTVNTYLKITDPDGVVYYAHFPNEQNQTADDPMDIVSEKTSLTGVLWNVRDFEWTFNRYTLPQDDRTGTWTWEFFYEDVNRPGGPPPLASASATYTVYPSSTYRIAGTLTEPPDTDPPFVLSKSPSAGATTVPINTAINITFNEPMDQSATQGAFSLLRERSLITPGIVTWSDNSLTFTPDALLSYGKEYTVILRTDVADETGNTMELTEWVFTTEPAPPPPPINPPTIDIPTFSDQQRIWVVPNKYSSTIETAANILHDRGGGIVLVKPGEYDEWLNIVSNVYNVPIY